MKALTIAIGVIVLAVASSMWYGYVLSIVWGWFISPTFHLPVLNIPTAIGVACVVRCITMTPSGGKDADSEGKTASQIFTAGLIKSFSVPAVTLLFCWIVTFWM